MGLLLLADQGLVDLEQHPGAYVPEARGFDERVTIRQMLHHVSGLPEFLMLSDFKEKYAPGTPEKLREHLKLLSGYPQYFAPGTDSLYCNINFVIPAVIIENVTGLSYEDYMQKAVFEPLGATLVVDRPGKEIPNRVQGYSLIDGQIVPAEKNHDWMRGGGDLVGRVDDAYCLNKAVKHRLLLRPETWEQVLTPYPLNNKGMGCTVTQWHGRTRIVHNGGNRGFRSYHVHLPAEDVDIIILSNAGYGSARQELTEAVYRAIFDAAAASETPLELDMGLV